MKFEVHTDDETIFNSFVNLAKSFEREKLTFKINGHTYRNWDKITPDAIACILEVEEDGLNAQITEGIKKRNVVMLIRGIRQHDGRTLAEAQDVLDLCE
jgi:hypothetical protein